MIHSLFLCDITGTSPKDYESEKTIMLVGATGSGKSTLADGIANFVMGVSFDDPFRFKMVTLEEEENKRDNQVIFVEIHFLGCLRRYKSGC